MQAVLYVSHGSRVEKTKVEAMEFMESVQKRVDVPLQETAFLELAAPDIAEGFTKLAEQGATKIAVVPVLLMSAGHYYEDIPEELAKVKKNYPDIKVTYGRPLGVQERLVEVLIDRIHETGRDVPRDAHLLLVGRGSRSPETKQATKLIAKRLKKKLGVKSVDTCYLAASKPSFDEGLEAVKQKKHSITFVIPYLWFTGLLMQEMEKKVQNLREQGLTIELCGYLGSHPSVVAALADRAVQAVQSDHGVSESYGVEESKAWWI
ncbi:sirohydrochlorin chelatase [Alkalicoccus daliensis]|uniref:Sirohydrochlorin ferrochelatase n=1 Tax=Alkalicoccus daliensis TaxID=745820 RepID=A0A1H0KQQ6_9BACI|nr:sirohydrochlorin chelatase [Alkalicoccus daliensis]SDO58103.1 sirohydrochlorin ferrochelatase [Alkalicoccus daliensis]